MRIEDSLWILAFPLVGLVAGISEDSPLLGLNIGLIIGILCLLIIFIIYFSLEEE